MPARKPTLEEIEAAKKKLGRPELPIDWSLLDHLLLAGCSIAECSTHFNLTAERLGERIHKQYGMYSNEYSHILRSKGDSLIRSAQMKKALSGDNTMLVWLGKNKLAQRDTPETQTVTEDTLKQFNALMAQFQSVQNAKKEEASSE